MNKFYNGKSRHICLRHNIVRQLLDNGVIYPNCVRSKVNLIDPLTKSLGRKLVYTSRGIALMPVKKTTTMVNQTI